jgi:putative redox protein
MVQIDIEYSGDLHTTCRHAPSGSEIATDAPVDNEGRGETFSPTDLLATAFGTCMLTVMGIVARRHDWPLAGARASVEKHMVADPIRRVGRLVVRLELPAAIPEEARKVLEQTAQSCPVKESLHPDIDLCLEFDWSGSGG